MANISNEFKGAVKKYVQIDNERKLLSKKSSQLKKDQDNIENFILTFMESNNMNDKNSHLSKKKDEPLFAMLKNKWVIPF